MSTTPSQRPARTAPEDAPDLLGISLAHRLMRKDLHRLSDVAAAIGRGAPCSDRRAAAVAHWVDQLCEEIHDHHTNEDTIAWPVIARYAGSQIDLTELSDDHGALDPLMARVRVAATALTAARTDRAGAARELAERLGTLRDEVDEHLDAEEETLFPIIVRYVPGAEWRTVEEEVKKGGPGMRFTLPRMLGVTTASERSKIRAEAGPVLAVLLAVLGPAHRRRERLVFGA